MKREPFSTGEYYHLYNRGTNKMPIFQHHKDYLRFQKLMYLCNIIGSPKYSDIETSPGRTWTIENKDTLVEIGAYCLMPNHFHLLVKIKEPKDASNYMQKLLTAYSMYFNKKYERTGSLFQGKTKSQHAGHDRFLKYLYSYIHLNPVKIIDSRWKEDGLTDLKKTLDFLNSYQYSSFQDYTKEGREESKIINKSEFPEYFTNPNEHIDELTEWLNFNKNNENN